MQRESPQQLGLSVESAPLPGAAVRLTLASTRLAYGVRIDAPGFLASDDGFFIEPGGTRSVTLHPTAGESPLGSCKLGAVNMLGHLDWNV